MPVTSRLRSLVLEVVGALAGGFLGYLLFGWIVSQGFYAMMIPGALLGVGAGLFASDPSPTRGALCALAAVFVGLLAEWNHFPFVADPSLRYFLGHLTELKGLTLLLIALGAGLAYYLGKDAGWLGGGGRSA